VVNVQHLLTGSVQPRKGVTLSQNAAASVPGADLPKASGRRFQEILPAMSLCLNSCPSFHAIGFFKAAPGTNTQIS